MANSKFLDPNRPGPIDRETLVKYRIYSLTSSTHELDSILKFVSGSQIRNRFGKGLKHTRDKLGLDFTLSSLGVRVFFQFTYSVTAIVAISSPMVMIASTTAIVT